MSNTDPRPGTTTAELFREAIDESGALLKLEITLAKGEVRLEIAAMKSAVVAFVVAALLANLALSCSLFALLLALRPGLYPALVAGGIFLVAAAIAGLIGYHLVPKNPMAKTREHIESDLRVFRDRTE
jgi:hypothetical protein